MSITITLTPDHSVMQAQLPSGRMLEVPPTVAGVNALYRILRAQTALPADHPPAMGTDAAPVQSMVDRWLAAGNTPRKFDERGREKVDLEQLGEITLDDITAAMDDLANG